MHAAVAGEKVAAETLGDAVGLVLTHELARVKLQDGHLMAGVGVDLTIEVTLDIVQVQHPGVAGGPLVDAEKPLHVAVTQPGVATQQKLGKLVCN